MIADEYFKMPDYKYMYYGRGIDKEYHYRFMLFKTTEADQIWISTLGNKEAVINVHPKIASLLKEAGERIEALEAEVDFLKERLDER